MLDNPLVCRRRQLLADVIARLQLSPWQKRSPRRHPRPPHG
jgi:hypothetical protein